MPITLFLDDSKFDPGAKRVVSVAFEMARVALQLGNQGNLFRAYAVELNSDAQDQLVCRCRR